MSETIKCKKCGEEWDVQVDKNDVLTFTGLCWTCHRFEVNQETPCDCVTRTIRDFRNFSQDDYMNWLKTDNRLRSLPEAQKRQLNALILNIETRSNTKEKDA